MGRFHVASAERAVPERRSSAGTAAEPHMECGSLPRRADDRDRSAERLDPILEADGIQGIEAERYGGQQVVGDWG